MHSHSLPVENSAAVRAGLLSFISRQVGPLFDGAGLRGQLTDWLAPLGCAEIARALRPDATETCDRLADALLRNSVDRDPGEAIYDVIACSFPKLGHVDRTRLAEFTRALRDLAIRNDGSVTDRDFRNAGFGASESLRFLPMAEATIARLNGSAPPEQAVQGEATRRLIEAGTRAGLRFNPNAEALRVA